MADDPSDTLLREAVERMKSLDLDSSSIIFESTPRADSAMPFIPIPQSWLVSAHQKSLCLRSNKAPNKEARLTFDGRWTVKFKSSNSNPLGEVYADDTDDVLDAVQDFFDKA